MAAMLASLQQQLSVPLEDGYINSANADRYAEMAAQEADPIKRFNYSILQSNQLLNAGRTSEAIPLLENAVASMDQGAFALPSEHRSKLLRMLAIAYLRMGEQANCLNNHNNESCIFPLSEKARHMDPTGSRKAIGMYERILQEFPDNLGSRWLINVAYMTLGEYPDHVPAKWLIPEKAFGPKDGFPHFEEVAGPLGLAVNDLCGGTCMEDFNGDGLLDIMASSWALSSQVRLFLSNGDGSFTDRTMQAGLKGITGALNMIHADYDNDGNADVLMLRGAWRGRLGEQPRSLLRNRGDGTFEDVTKAAGLLTFHPTQNASWADYDNDGYLDLFIGNESSQSAKRDQPSELFHNNGNGTFTEVAAQMGLQVIAFVKGSTWGDVNNDAYPDLYVSIQGAPNKLFLNPGPSVANGAQFQDVAEAAGVTLPIWGFPAWFWDFNNDGWLDLYAGSFPSYERGEFSSHIAAHYLGIPTSIETPRLYLNKGDGTFADVTRTAGLDQPLFAMGSNYGDLDNDGYPDFYLGTGEPTFESIIPNRMFHNEGNGTFRDVTTATGTGSLQKGHGVAFGDMDNDGDQDIYIVMGGAYEGDVYPNLLFENPGMGNHWISLQLQGTKTNRCAIGSRIRVTVSTPHGERDIHEVVGTGGSFGSSSLRQEIGLGDATAIKQIEVFWPVSREKQVFTDVPMDTGLELTEGTKDAQVPALPKVKLHGNGGVEMEHHHAL